MGGGGGAYAGSTLGLGYGGYANGALPIEAVHQRDNAPDNNRNWPSKPVYV